MSLLAHSQYQKFANQELDWLGLDSKEQYQWHIETRKDLLEQNNWIDAKFTYKFNSHGFRCDEFSDAPSAMFLGCSFTQGIGLPIQHTWCYLVAQQLNYHCVNLGVGGGSNDTTFRLAHHWTTKIRPKVIFLLSPFRNRLEVLDKNNPESFYKILNPKTAASGASAFYAQWLMTEDNNILNQEKNIMAIANLAKEQNIKLVVLKADMVIDQITSDSARDLSHPGIRSNISLATKFLELL